MQEVISTLDTKHYISFIISASINLNRLSDSDCGRPPSQFHSEITSQVHAVGIGGGGGGTQQRWSAERGVTCGTGGGLPAVMPAPVVAAAGESLTVSVPPPAVYGYTPEGHAGTGREERGRLRESQKYNRIQTRIKTKTGRDITAIT